MPPLNGRVGKTSVVSVECATAERLVYAFAPAHTDTSQREILCHHRRRQLVGYCAVSGCQGPHQTDLQCRAPNGPQETTSETLGPRLQCCGARASTRSMKRSWRSCESTSLVTRKGLTSLFPGLEMMCMASGGTKPSLGTTSLPGARRRPRWPARPSRGPSQS